MEAFGIDLTESCSASSSVYDDEMPSIMQNQDHSPGSHEPCLQQPAHWTRNHFQSDPEAYAWTGVAHDDNTPSLSSNDGHAANPSSANECNNRLSYIPHQSHMSHTYEISGFLAREAQETDGRFSIADPYTSLQISTTNTGSQPRDTTVENQILINPHEYHPIGHHHWNTQDHAHSHTSTCAMSPPGYHLDQGLALQEDIMNISPVLTSRQTLGRLDFRDTPERATPDQQIVGTYLAEIFRARVRGDTVPPLCQGLFGEYYEPPSPYATDRMIRVEGKKGASCPRCNQWFSRPGNCRKHMRKFVCGR